MGWSRQRRKPLPLLGVSSIFTAAYSSIQELMVPDPALALPRVTMVEWEVVVLQVGEHYIWWDPNNYVASLTESQHSHVRNAAQELQSPMCNLGTYVQSCQRVDAVSRVHTNGYDARTVAGCTSMDEYAHKLTSAGFCLIFSLRVLWNRCSLPLVAKRCFTQSGWSRLVCAKASGCWQTRV